MSKSSPTNLQSIDSSLARLRHHYETGATRPLAYRLKQLDGLQRFLRECDRDIEQALHQDLKKSAMESFVTETTIIYSELHYVRKHLSSWIKPKKVSTILPMQPGKSYVYPEPLGLVLIISPWNYPIQIPLVALIGALAAGNCAVIKPSEVAPASSQLLAEKLPHYIDPACLHIIQGGVEETTMLLKQAFDHIHYTGNTTVGKVVMEAAAKHLTPVTLELGGKSPCIIDETANIEVTAKRIVWAKFSNAGQTCVAPDYLLVHKNVEDTLLQHMIKAIHEFYGDNSQTSRDYSRIINAKHYQRLIKLLSGNGEIVTGGKTDESDLYIAPTILRHVKDDAPIMSDEIFGPILPVISIASLDDAITFIRMRPKPLALYMFSESKLAQQQIVTQTTSGSVCINHAMMQLAVPALPFGGVGASGMGTYHGKASFDAFTHYKSILYKPTWLDLRMMYPPYGRLLNRILSWYLNT
jgi:acyl-CoA reductase-like NAD-dependent aldehyde dehydrogenase